MSHLIILMCLVLLGTGAALSLQEASTRRQWLAGAGFATATVAATMIPSTCNADPGLVSGLQGPVQDAIAPGHWLGQFFGINSKTERWEFPNNTPQQVSAALVDVLNGLTPDRRMKLLIPEFNIQRADATNVHVLTWTKLEWLDTLDVKLKESSLPSSYNNRNGCIATASFYATGFLPTSIPLAPLANIAMAWLPFGSPGPRGEMLQDFRLRALKSLVVKRLDEQRPDVML